MVLGEDTKMHCAGRGGPTILVGLALLAFSSLGVPQETATRDAPAYLRPCLAAIEQDPHDPEGYSCLYRAARAEAQSASSESIWEETTQTVQRTRGQMGIAPWWMMTLGNLAWVRDPDEALEHYREAAEGFAAEGLSRGEVLARFNLRMLLKQSGDLEAAGEQVKLAVAAAEGSSDPGVLAQALLLEATHLMESGGDLAEAEIALRRAERAAFPDGSYSLKRNCLVTQANLYYRLGHFERAVGVYRRTAELAAENDDPTEAANTAYNLANGRLRQLESFPEPGGIEEVERLGRQALASAQAARLRGIEARSHRLLGDLLWRTGRTEEAQLHLDRCLELALEIGDPERELSCRLNRAEALARADPVAAERDSLAALDLAESTASERYLAYAWRARMRIAWQTSDPSNALDDSMRALDAIERLRDSQRESAGSVGVFSAWTDDYYWLAGRLLSEDLAATKSASATAFALAERMRGRQLLEELGARRESALGPEAQPLLDRLRQLRKSLVQTQRRLLRPDLEPAERRDLLRRLAELEIEERALLLRFEAPSQSPAAPPPLTGLESLRDALAPDQALLYFLVGLDRDLFDQPAGGAWLWVVTRDRERVVPIPDRVDLESRVSIFQGLVESRDPLENEAGATLFHTLLQDGLRDLPEDIRRLVIVPDGVLHHLPFGALRTDPDAPPLGSRFQLVLSPSATLWQRWQGLQTSPAAAPALVFADPARIDATPDVEPAPTRSLASARLDSATLDLGSPAALSPLPGARREARSVRRLLGRDTRILTGSEASERALKTAAAGDFDILHFATHAVANEAHPHRSCVILAPGHPEEDGLLQVAEAERLHLEGRIVVLSACSTAAGAVRGGEGVMSLARAFFRAGARTVVASRWPLRDDEAQRFFDRFYRRLARGETVGEAARQARDRLYSEGLPGAAWAGVVILGDDGGRVQRSASLTPAATGALGLLALFIGACLVVALIRRLRTPD